MRPLMKVSIWTKACRLAVVLGSVAAFQALPAFPAHAGDETFIDGLAAYDGGDVAKTVRIWTALAETGDANAQVGLAGLYLAGSGVQRDPSAAAELYRLAAEQGDSNGQLNLGRLHLDGIGVERDLGAAYAWLTLAAAQDRRWAEEKRLAIEPILTDEQRASAETLIESIKSR
ncbi:MAG: tetratricopeptide repeat protein [Pseudomonadota bacterium]